MRRHFKKSNGFTLIELMITMVIVALLASVAMPLMQLSVQRQKESELRAYLRQIRTAIDAYKQAYDEGKIALKNEDQSGYPPNLEILVEGVTDLSDPNRKRKLKFLRRIPIDPMFTNDDIINGEPLSPSWGLRSYESSPDQPRPGEDVYDVYSLSPKIGINGVPYAQW